MFRVESVKGGLLGTNELPGLVAARIGEGVIVSPPRLAGTLVRPRALDLDARGRIAKETTAIPAQNARLRASATYGSTDQETAEIVQLLTMNGPIR